MNNEMLAKISEIRRDVDALERAISAWIERIGDADRIKIMTATFDQTRHDIDALEALYSDR